MSKATVAYRSWAWRFPRDAWFDRLHSSIDRWQPHTELALEDAGLRERLHAAAEDRSDWLVHPCANALTLRMSHRRLQRDFQLALWVAANGAFAGEMTVPEPVWAWSSDGGRRVEPGSYELSELATQSRVDRACAEIAVDPWGDSVGLWLAPPAAGASAPESSSPARDEEELAGEIARVHRTVHIVRKLSPDCFDWMVEVTKVVLLLPAQPGRVLNWSRADLPGAVSMTSAPGVLETVETLVHESAHRYFFVAEATGPLVDPAHRGAYTSPLRPDPRPLRGVFLACHALAYMLAGFRALDEGTGTGEASATERFAQMRTQFEEADGVLATAGDHLTDLGVEVAARTREVAHAAISR